MYSDKQNIRMLTALMRKACVTEVVVCPGSRNAPIVHNFKEAGFACYEITDERSAGFFALGLIEAKGRAVAVCCTSGSAVLNLAPAVAEAYYHPLPLLVITADRPPCWIGQQDGQTMPQPPAFGSLVRKMVSLPEFREEQEEERWYCNRLVNEAFIALKRYGGPVHINVPVTEPLFRFTAQSLPTEERLIGYSVPEQDFPETAQLRMADECTEAQRIMIIVGQMTPTEAIGIAPYMETLIERGVVVIAERLANLKLSHPTPYNFDSILAAYLRKEKLAPDMVVTMGGHIVSKRIKQFLRGTHPRVHWHVSPHGELADLFCCATRLVESSAKRAAAFLAKHVTKPCDREYAARWMRLSDMAEEKMKRIGSYGLSDIAAIQTVTDGLHSRWDIQVANSNSVRHLQMLHDDKHTVMCNRGINGIEGSLSTAAGYVAGGRPTLLIIGDLSFFYDRNGLWNNFMRRRKGDGSTAMPDAPLRILLLNNQGGQIFHSLPGLPASPYLSTYIAAEHTTSAKETAQEGGFRYLKASNRDELESCKKDFLEADGKVAILEVLTDAAANEAAVSGFYRELEDINDI